MTFDEPWIPPQTQELGTPDNGALGDVLTGTAGSEQTFHTLEDANAFVVSLDPERSWFRYHYLFGDLLRLELRRTAPHEVPELHRRGRRTQHRQKLPGPAPRRG